jgi:hypothetical protein
MNRRSKNGASMGALLASNALPRQSLILLQLLAVATDVPGFQYLRPSKAQSFFEVLDSDYFFVDWHGLSPGQCSGPPPETQTCESPGTFLTSLILFNGSRQGFPGVWQVSGVCNNGLALLKVPSTLTWDADSPVNEQIISFEQGLTNISGRSGTRVDAILGYPGDNAALPLNGVPWSNSCPTGKLISGYQMWGSDASCVASGIRFQCRNSIEARALVEGEQSPLAVTWRTWVRGQFGNRCPV